MPCELGVISQGGCLALRPKSMWICGILASPVPANAERERGRDNQIETCEGRDGLLGLERWTLLYLPRAADSKWGSSRPGVITLGSWLIVYNEQGASRFHARCRHYFSRCRVFIAVCLKTSCDQSALLSGCYACDWLHLDGLRVKSWCHGLDCALSFRMCTRKELHKARRCFESLS